MPGYTRLLTCLAAFAVVCAVAAPAVSAAPAKRPIVLLFHGGGFVFGAPEAERDNADFYRAHGYRPVLVSYPLFNLPGAHKAASAAAARYRRSGAPVFSSGTSAGGGLASYLAATGKVDAGVGVCPLTNYVTWYDANWNRNVKAIKTTTRSRYSTLYNRRPVRSPLAVFSSPQDRVVPFSTAAALDRRPGVTLTRLTGDHCADTSWRGPAVRFLNRQVRAAKAEARRAARAKSRRR